MNTDHTFQIGKDHIVCEDYALSGAVKTGAAYAIVCDGCSASPDVDFGARALAFSATRTLGVYLGVDYPPERFGEITIRAANRIFDVFPHLHPQFLDATLLTAWVENRQLTAYLYGDGVFIHKTKNGIKSIHIHLTSGAPDYLSYHLDTNRKDSYDSMEGNKKVVVFDNFGKPEDFTFPIFGPYNPFEPVVVETHVEEGDIVAVISDGINSFRKIDNESINWKDLIDEFTGYKTTEGQFVLRRISAFKRKCLKEGTTHSDDISIASIVI